MRAKDVSIEWLKERLDGWEGSSGQFYAYCPVHDDLGTAVKGLSISVKPNGKILCKCHSPHCGATLTQVIQALEGYTRDDETEPVVNVRKRPSTKGKAGLEAWAHYTHVGTDIWEMLGCLDHGSDAIKFTFAESDVIKVRRFPKEIHFEPKGVEVSPLWPIPQDELPEHISITEGESDCGTTYAAGLPPGFSVTKGSDTPLSVATFQALASRGVREITIYADADLSGDSLKDRCVSLAIDAGLAINVCDLTRVVDPFFPHKDLNSLWKDVRDRDLFCDLVDRATMPVAKNREYLTVDAILELAGADIDWIIDDLIAPRDKVLIWGPPKTYKTWVVLDLIRSLTTCTPFLQRKDWTPKHPRRVLLIEEEGSPELFARRIRRLHLTNDDPFMLVHRRNVRFTNPDDVAFVISMCREYEIDVVIFDPLQRMIPGVNENDAAETGVVWDEIARIQTQCPSLTCVVVHHGSKSEIGGWHSSRGSSRHGGEVDLGIQTQKHPHEDNAIAIWMDGRETHAELEPGGYFKGTVEITDTDFSINANQVEVQVTKTKREDTKENNRFDIYRAVQNGHDTRTLIMRATGLSDATVREHLKALIEDGMVTEEKVPGKPNKYRETNADES